MKKLIIVLSIIILCMVLNACATIEYTVSSNFDFTVTQNYSVELDNEYLIDNGTTPEEMKEFLFEFFSLYSMAELSQDDFESDEVKVRKDEDKLDLLFSYTENEDEDEYIVNFSQTFDDEQAFNKYYGESGSSDELTIQKTFLYYRIIQKVDSPFVVIADKRNEIIDGTPPSGELNFADIFIHGLKNGGKTIFEGFKARFPNIKPEDMEQLLYRFVYAYARGMMENTADKQLAQGYQTYLVWERDNESMADEITLVTLKPNSVGWNILLLIITAVFAAVLIVAALLIKKRRPKLTPLPPPPLHVPPSVFGDEYR